MKHLIAMLFAATSVHASAAPEFSGIERWLNSPPLSMGALRGKVVLLDFWTYTCINCIRTLPHVKSWHEKYKDKGLVVVGVHTPEYPFERSTANVQAAIKRFGIAYPVAQDNRYATWQAYDNQYWPAVYLIDRQGRIAYTHFGEGAYEQTEARIRALLDQAP
jgi:thiol-disulfide isomerase/thioredoxin